MATLQSGKCFTVPTFFGMCCRSEWQERMYIYKWHEVDQTKHEIFCVHIVCNEIQVKVNLEITTFFFYLRFPYCPNFFWFGVVCNLTLFDNWIIIIYILFFYFTGEDRGPVLEVIVSRTNFISSHTSKQVRVVGLSTALANARDLADWLGIGQVRNPRQYTTCIH